MSHVPEQTIVGGNVGFGSAWASFGLVVGPKEQSRLKRTADAMPRVTTTSTLINIIFQIQVWYKIKNVWQNRNKWPIRLMQII